MQEHPSIHLGTDFEGLFQSFGAGRHTVCVEIPSPNLESGTYAAWFRLVSPKADILLDAEKVVLRVRGQERDSPYNAVVAVERAWSWSSDEERAVNVTPLMPA